MTWTGVPQLKAARIGVATTRHRAACARLAVRLERAERASRCGRPRLRAAEVGAIRALATAQLDHLPDGRPHSRRPALLLFPDAAPLIAVEVQLSVEGSRRLEAICRGWARCPIDSEVGYYAVPQVQRAASRAVSGACAEDVIRGSR